MPALLWLHGAAIATAFAFGVVLLKASGAVLLRDWYRTTAIQNVALLETLSALTLPMITVLSLLLVRLPERR